jgi:hypothetical protein
MLRYVDDRDHQSLVPVWRDHAASQQNINESHRRSKESCLHPARNQSGNTFDHVLPLGGAPFFAGIGTA